MCAAEMTSAIADVFTAIATTGAVIVAGVGLKAWKRELKGRADFDAARAMARATYGLRDAIGSCRSPFLSGHEFPDGDMESANAYASLYQTRWRAIGDALVVFDAAVLEAEALWGAEPRESADKLKACVVELSASIDAFIADKRVKGQNFEVDRAFGVRVRSTITGALSDEKNEFSTKIRGTVAGIEGLLKQHLARS